MYGVKFDKVVIEQDKLLITLDCVVEAVFKLDFKATGYGQPILHLYDYRMLVPELGDQFFVHGCEFKTESAAN